MTYCVSEFVAEEISIGNISSWQKLNRIKICPGYTTSPRNCIVHCVKKMRMIKLVQRGECWWLYSESVCLSKPLLHEFFYLILKPEAPSQVESVGHRELNKSCGRLSLESPVRPAGQQSTRHRSLQLACVVRPAFSQKYCVCMCAHAPMTESLRAGVVVFPETPFPLPFPHPPLL